MRYLIFSDAWQFAGVVVCYFRRRRTADEFAKKCKSRSQEAWPKSYYLFFIGLGPLYISGNGKARDCKFGVRIDLQAYKPENAKVDEKGLGLRHVTYLYIFVPLTIPVERLNWQTSYLVHRLTTRGAIQKCKNCSTRFVDSCVTYFWIVRFGLNISVTDKVIDLKFGATAGGSRKFKAAPLNAPTPITP